MHISNEEQNLDPEIITFFKNFPGYEIEIHAKYEGHLLVQEEHDFSHDEEVIADVISKQEKYAIW